MLSPPRTTTRLHSVLLFLTLLLFSAAAARAAASAADLAPKLGFNYVSWRTGDYPYTISWKVQTWPGSQGVAKVDLTPTRRYKSKGALELLLEVAASGSNPQGEIFLDARYPPNYQAAQAYAIQMNAANQPLGVDLSGKTLAALVYCAPGTGADETTPSGLQFFAKSMKVVDGQEQWSSCYGLWHNIRAKGDKSLFKWLDNGKYLSHVFEGKWSLVSLRLPGGSGPQPPPEQLYNYVDPGFDPSCVALIGIKYGLNDKYYGALTGKLWLDNLGWMALSSDGPTGFSFRDVPLAAAPKLWDYFLKRSGPKKIKTTARAQQTVQLAGERVVFPVEDTADPLASMKKNGFSVAVLVQTEYMDALTSTAIAPVAAKSHTPEELAAAIDYAKSLGLAVVLKPHVDISAGGWRGEIVPADVLAWFDSYASFIANYAALAQAHGVDALVVGTEFCSLSGAQNRAAWEIVVARARAAYSGKIIYAASWDEYPTVCFWDLVDAAGIDAYFPLTPAEDPALDELISAWSGTVYKDQPHNWLSDVTNFQGAIGKEVIFTEIGYRSTDYAAFEPWDFSTARPPNPQLQARCYQAAVETFKDVPWCGGLWFWNRQPEKDAGGLLDTGFTTQHKPADSLFRSRRRKPR